MRSPEDEGPKRCPRCRGFIPSNDKPGEYPGAMSRADNRTEVCSACGLEEAFIDLEFGQYRGDQAIHQGKHLWPLLKERSNGTS